MKQANMNNYNGKRMEIDYEKLSAIGIDAQQRKGTKQKMFCPECHDSRKNKSDKSLSVNWERCVA